MAEEGDRSGDPEVPAGRDLRHQLPEEVAAYVRELILSGKVKHGEFLRTHHGGGQIDACNVDIVA